MTRAGAQSAKVTWTYRDVRQMPDDRQRYEVIEGDLFVTPAPTTTHQKISKRIGLALMLQVEERGLGVVFNAPVDVILSDTRVVEPDLLVVLHEREAIVSERGIEGAPDLVIEILSPRTARTDREIKRKLYASAGVREYWLVDPSARRIEVLALAEADYVERGTYGPGAKVTSVLFELDLDVDAVFR